MPAPPRPPSPAQPSPPDEPSRASKRGQEPGGENGQGKRGGGGYGRSRRRGAKGNGNERGLGGGWTWGWTSATSPIVTKGRPEQAENQHHYSNKLQETAGTTGSESNGDQSQSPKCTTEIKVNNRMLCRRALRKQHPGLLRKWSRKSNQNKPKQNQDKTSKHNTGMARTCTFTAPALSPLPAVPTNPSSRGRSR